MKAWVHVEDGILRGVMLTIVPRDELACELGEWVLMGVVPALHDFGDEPITVGKPLPVIRQLAFPC